MKKRVYTILEVLFIALFIFSLSQLIKIGLNYRRGNQLYEGVQNKVGEVTENKDYHFVVDLTELQKTNEDIVGWIKIPDTPVDYPVLQPDNNQYYLKHTYDNIYRSTFRDSHRRIIQIKDSFISFRRDADEIIHLLITYHHRQASTPVHHISQRTVALNLAFVIVQKIA